MDVPITATVGDKEEEEDKLDDGAFITTFDSEEDEDDDDDQADAYDDKTNVDDEEQTTLIATPTDTVKNEAEENNDHLSVTAHDSTMDITNEKDVSTNTQIDANTGQTTTATSSSNFSSTATLYVFGVVFGGAQKKSAVFSARE